MNNEVLETYNKNTYIKICKFLYDNLDEITLFLKRCDESEKYNDLASLQHIFSELFHKKVLSNHIQFEIKRLFSSTVLQTHIEKTDANSYYHLTLKISAPVLVKLDEMYSHKLSSLLKFYKNLFSRIDNPSKRLSSEVQETYLKFIAQLKNDIGQFVEANLDRKVIATREKLNEQKLKRLPFPGFYHMTHINNLKSILEHGLVSHTEAHQNGYVSVDISNQEVNARRQRTENIHGRTLHDYVPLYINPRNAMMYVKSVNDMAEDLVLIEVLPHIIAQFSEAVFTDGNAANDPTQFYGDLEDFDKLSWEVLNAQYWCNFNDGKRKICSEVLIPGRIPLTYIQRIIYHNEAILNNILQVFPNRFGITIEKNAKMFFK